MTNVFEAQSRFLLESVSGSVRKCLVRERVHAMRGDLDGALSSIERAIRTGSPERPGDRVALGMLWAELLDADSRAEEAAEVFGREVTPLINELPQQHRFAIEQNRVDLSVQFWKSPDEFYHLVDRRRLADFEWLDYEDLFEAKQSAEKGKHYETLPLLWRQLRRSYLSGCWYAQRVTASLFAAECVALGQWDEAVHHLIACRDEDAVERVAEGVAQSGPEVIRAVIDRVLATANLKSHFVVGCKLLTAMHDVIPDSDLPRVAEWLYPRAADVRKTLVGPNPVWQAWKAVGSIGYRLPAGHALKWLKMATAHPIWTTRDNLPDRVIVERESVVGTVLALASVRRHFPEEQAELARLTLPILADCRFATDYAGVVDLLCNLAEWGGESLKRSLAETLYPAGQRVNSQLVFVAGYFDKAEDLTPEILGKSANYVATQIRLQVQWLDSGVAPKQPAEQLIHFGRQTDDRELHVYQTNNSGLASIAQHRAKLPEPALTELVLAVIEMASERDNFCSNREHLLVIVRDFADSVTPVLRSEIIDSLLPMVRGPVLESEFRSIAADSKNSLNPYKMGMGSPEQVQAMATVALAAFALPDESNRNRLWPVLTPQLYDPRGEIRRGSYAALRLCPAIDADALAGLLGGLRDPDADVAVTAFAAIASQPVWKFDKNQTRAFLFAARFASRSPSAKLRRHAATAVAARKPSCRRDLRAELAALLSEFARDAAASVRNAVR